MDDRARGEMLLVGQVTGSYGVRGWVRVRSHTAPRENLLRYQPWYLSDGARWQETEVVSARLLGSGLIALLGGVSDRDAARSLLGRDIAVRRGQLPELEPGDYYWADLEGLRVETLDGIALGVLDHLLETGANDVMVVRGERERLIPYLWGDVVAGVDLDARRMVVDWDPSF